MDRVCEFCGVTFDGASQARFCSNAHRVAAGRKRTGKSNTREVERALAVRVHETGENGRPVTLRGLISAARRKEIVLTDREEHLIRVHFGYSSSERRTLLQRDEVALRVRQGLGPVPEEGSTVIRFAADGTPVEEPVGPAGLSLVAFPNQRANDLAPTAAELQRLGETQL